MGILVNSALLVALGLMCSWPQSIVADEGAASLKAKVQTQEDEIKELQEKIQALKKEVDKRDQKGMELMKSYKTCSDKMDEIYEKEAEKQWKPNVDNMIQDMGWLHTENQKNVKDLETCKKKRKVLRKKLSALKKSQGNCLTKEALDAELDELKAVAQDRSQYMEKLSDKFGKCLIENSGKSQEELTGKPSRLPRMYDDIKDFHTVDTTVEGLQQQLKRCRVFGADIHAAHDNCQENLHEALLSKDRIEDQLEHSQESIKQAFEKSTKMQRELNALKEGKAAENQCEDLGLTELSGQEKLDALQKENTELKEEKVEWEKTNNIIEIYALNAEALDKKNKDCEKSLKECQQEKVQKKVQPKAELYSVKPEDAGKVRMRKTARAEQSSDKSTEDLKNPDVTTCEEKLALLQDEKDKLQNMIDTDTQYGIQCMVQKQNLKVSRWFLKKKYFAEIQKAGELAKQLEELKQEGGECVRDENTDGGDTTKDKEFEIKINKLETQVSDLLKNLEKCRKSHETAGEKGQGGDLAHVTDERNNCLETLKFCREKFTKLESDMKEWKPGCDTLLKKNIQVEEDFKACYIERDQVNFKVKGMEMLTDSLEKDLEKEQEKFTKAEKTASTAVKDASNFMFSFGVTMVVLVVVLTANLYSFVANRLQESDADRKQKLREEKEHRKLAERADRRATKKVKSL